MIPLWAWLGVAAFTIFWASIPVVIVLVAEEGEDF